MKYHPVRFCSWWETGHIPGFSVTQLMSGVLGPKEMQVVEDAEHIDLYDRRDRIPFDRLAEFFTVTPMPRLGPHHE